MAGGEGGRLFQTVFDFPKVTKGRYGLGSISVHIFQALYLWVLLNTGSADMIKLLVT